ncbi:unnamed protein product [Darwinula stevensoni]|uniref:Uncharacterized protein n=1 Tax=Darwinula stevensoni TaxID=69355 RepID=A0A7R8XBT1_9CRUS|nr:unnamed protein product [Darwinula stevensoni]CAG0891320.1 unnamed protein product [Darwinula stevensoni]
MNYSLGAPSVEYNAKYIINA